MRELANTGNLKQTKPQEEGNAKGNGNTEQEQGRASFPRYPLKDSLKVAQTIWDKFAGNPTSLLDLAEQLKYAPKTTNFKYLLRASQRYGLTLGVWTEKLTEKISITSLGKSIIAPSMSDDVTASYRKALEMPSIFHKLYISLYGKIIPPDHIILNTLQRDYGLSKTDANQFLKVFSQNVTDYSLAQDIQGKRYFNMDRLSAKVLETTLIAQEEPEEQDTNEIGTAAQMPAEEKLSIIEESPRVFISHSKNKKIVEQIKQMLEFGKFEYEVAEERETTAIPISDKVFGLMRKCNCAIINVSADEEKKRDDGTFGINENVLIEIGGAFLHYDKRVILLADKRFKEQLPSNIKGLYMTFYEGDDLSWDTGMRLQKALTEFRSEL